MSRFQNLPKVTRLALVGVILLTGLIASDEIRGKGVFRD